MGFGCVSGGESLELPTFREAAYQVTGPPWGQSPSSSTEALWLLAPPRPLAFCLRSEMGEPSALLTRSRHVPAAIPGWGGVEGGLAFL